MPLPEPPGGREAQRACVRGRDRHHGVPVPHGQGHAGRLARGRNAGGGAFRPRSGARRAATSPPCSGLAPTSRTRTISTLISAAATKVFGCASDPATEHRPLLFLCLTIRLVRLGRSVTCGEELSRSAC